jgi:hypothetical protein
VINSTTSPEMHSTRFLSMQHPTQRKVIKGIGIPKGDMNHELQIVE